MSHTVVAFDLRCNKTPSTPDPVYRVFLDGQLIVERRFWPLTPDYYIQEQLTMTDDNQHHIVTVKNVFADRGEIFIHDVAFFDGANRQPLNINYTVDPKDQIAFVLQKR